LVKIDVIDKAAARDAIMLRMPKTYPACFSTNDQFDELHAVTETP